MKRAPPTRRFAAVRPRETGAIRNRPAGILAAVILALVLSSCGGGEGTDPEVTAPRWDQARWDEASWRP